MNIDVFDLGFLYVKSIMNQLPVKMKSVVGEGKKLQFRDMNIHDQCEDDYSCILDSKEYFVSDLAIKQSDSVIHSLKPDRFDSDSARVLLNCALGLGYRGQSAATRFVTGLPVTHYTNYKEDLHALLMEEHSYDICIDGKETYKGVINPIDTLIVPQPFGAAMDLLLDDTGKIIDKKLASKTIAIIDIGFGTSDIYVMEALDTIERMTFSSNTAVNHSYSLIADRLQDKFEVLYPLYKIEGVVKSGKIRKYGKSYSMAKTTNWALNSSAKQLVSEIYNKWRTSQDIDQIYVTGGGGAAMFEYLEPEFPNISLLPNSQWSVANGCGKWGIRNYGRGN